MNLEIITIFETIYLLYMYFIFKTSYSFDSAIFDNKVQNLGYFFIHNTSINENKICKFGKLMAVIAIILAFIRLDYPKESTQYITILFSVICLFLAFIMNMNAFIYILPLVICEIYILSKN